MGAFYLAPRTEKPHQSRGIIEERFRAQGLRCRQHLSTRHWALYIFRKINVDNDNIYIRDSDNFIFSAGTFIYKDNKDAQALALFYTDQERGAIQLDDLYGSYCIGISRDGNLSFLVDRSGIYKIYYNADQRIVSSSFLAVAGSIESRHTNDQATYEYVFQGATYGGETIVREIKILCPDQVIKAGKDIQVENIESESQDIQYKTNLTLEYYVESNLHALQNLYHTICKIFGDKIDCALSGGYDTRLMLALLRQQGVTPRLHVYGRASDPDVRVALAVAKGENLEIEHIEKSARPKPGMDAFPAVVARNFETFDGYPGDGIFDNGSDLATRMERCAHGEVMLNGGGGEIYRNFFYLRDVRYTIRQILWSFYSRFDPGVCTDRFSQADYLENLANKIRATLGVRGSRLERNQVEFIYPAFRCRFWMGRNTSINNRFGWALTPFVDHNIVRPAMAIPLGYKNHGRFEARLIREISPDLARYPSSYGHGFATDPPLGRVLKDWATYIRPTYLRKYSYRIRMRKRREFPYYLTKTYSGTCIDLKFPYMSQYFKIDKVTDPEHYNRICTLEYLFRELDFR